MKFYKCLAEIEKFCMKENFSANSARILIEGYLFDSLALVVLCVLPTKSLLF